MPKHAYITVACCLALIGLASAPAPPCLASVSDLEPERLAVHAAYDVGSATTKVKVARVDVGRGRIVETLLDHSEPVNYQQDLSRSEDKALSDAIQQRGLEVLRDLQAKASEHQPEREVGVATAVFREADAGGAVLQSLREGTGIELAIISDEQEAELGFHAAVADAEIEPGQAVVWDIGGGSMQLIALEADRVQDEPAQGADRHQSGGDPEYVYYQGRTASVRFRDRIIRELQGEDLEQVQSPNPISAETAEAALKLAKELAADLPADLAERIEDPGTTILGIGGVHYFSIRGQLEIEEGPYSREQVAERLEQRLGESDEEIGGDFADTEVSNLILVLGHMKQWDIDQVHPLHITMSDGLLVNPDAADSR